MQNCVFLEIVLSSPDIFSISSIHSDVPRDLHNRIIFILHLHLVGDVNQTDISLPPRCER